MQKSSKRLLGSTAAVVLFVFVAMLFPLIAREYAPPFLNKTLNFLSTFMLIGLFTAWGVSVNKRVVQVQARRYLLAVAVLAVFWIAVREIRYRFLTDAVILRQLWYAYYIPILLIPLLAFYVSLSLGKGEKFRIPKSALLAVIPTVAFIVLTLTNELHQLVFAFPEGYKNQTDTSYKYGVTFYLLTVWVVLLALASFVTMLTKSRTPKSRKTAWLPVIPFVCGVLYFLLYAIRIPFVWKYIGDVAVSWCLLFIGYFEACIQSGLIQTNTRYSDLFSASIGTEMQITDADFNVHYRAEGSKSFSKEIIKKAVSGTLQLDGGKRLHAIPVNGGFAVWTDDIAPLIELREALEAQSEELEERNALLQYEYEKEREHKVVEEQNRLYDLLQTKTQKQLNRIDRLVQQYKTESDPQKKRTILAEISVLGCFIKRRKNFVLALDEAENIPDSMLERALAESSHALGKLGVRCAFIVDTGEEQSGGTLALAYDFFEEVLEAVLDSCKYLCARICKVGSEVRVNVLTDSRADLTALKNTYKNLQIINEDDGTMLVLPLEEGGEA
ncbi:MAG: hypothetical protein E7571_06410 [Ruminococcaceae bacterium]|nr:hypothetical protein [Oscillospiraceae bacterium]